jgi:hypothetical protein
MIRNSMPSQITDALNLAAMDFFFTHIENDENMRVRENKIDFGISSGQCWSRARSGYRPVCALWTTHVLHTRLIAFCRLSFGLTLL